MAPTKAQCEFLRAVLVNSERSGRLERHGFAFLRSTELNGSQIRTAKVLGSLGLCESREVTGPDGFVSHVVALTVAGAEVAKSVANPND